MEERQDRTRYVGKNVLLPFLSRVAILLDLDIFTETDVLRTPLFKVFIEIPLYRSHYPMAY